MKRTLAILLAALLLCGAAASCAAEGRPYIRAAAKATTAKFR